MTQVAIAFWLKFVIDVLHLVQRDKQWIINIQLNQLKCDNPYVDDYYFTMYQVCAILAETFMYL